MMLNSALRAPGEGNGNIVSFPQASECDHGAAVLDLVYRAAEVSTGMEDRAREIEASARSMCQTAVDKLMLAERRIAEAERARRDVVHDAGAKLQEASWALQQAQSRIDAAERQIAAAEARAQAAEAQAIESRKLLARVETAIRSRFLGGSLELDSHEGLHDVA